jgi:hypothetical protein
LSAETHAYGISEISASFITAGSGAAVSEVFSMGCPIATHLLIATYRHPCLKSYSEGFSRSNPFHDYSASFF